MKPKQTTLTMRWLLEFKDSHFSSTEEVLKQPDTWSDLTPQSQRLIKSYAAKLSGSTSHFSEPW